MGWKCFLRTVSWFFKVFGIFRQFWTLLSPSTSSLKSTFKISSLSLSPLVTYANIGYTEYARDSTWPKCDVSPMVLVCLRQKNNCLNLNSVVISCQSVIGNCSTFWCCQYVNCLNGCLMEWRYNCNCSTRLSCWVLRFRCTLIRFNTLIFLAEKQLGSGRTKISKKSDFWASVRVRISKCLLPKLNLSWCRNWFHPIWLVCYPFCIHQLDLNSFCDFSS